MFGKRQCGVSIQCTQHCSGRNVRIFGNQSLQFTREPRNGQCAGHSVASHIHHHNVNATALGNTGVDEVTTDFVGRHVCEIKLQMWGANGLRKQRHLQRARLCQFAAHGEVPLGHHAPIEAAAMRAQSPPVDDQPRHQHEWHAHQHQDHLLHANPSGNFQ